LRSSPHEINTSLVGVITLIGLISLAAGDLSWHTRFNQPYRMTSSEASCDNVGQLAGQSGVASAPPPVQQMKAFVFKTPAAIFLAGLFATAGCMPAQDSKGRDPAEVVGLFVQAVNSNDFATARTYWGQGSVAAIEFMSDTNFAAFCEQRFRCSSHFTSRPRKQKMDFWNTEFYGVLPDRTNRYVFYLRKTGGEWKLQYSRGRR